MPTGVYERKAKALTVETGNEIERQEALAPDLPAADPPVTAVIEATPGNHRLAQVDLTGGGEVTISATPRPLPKAKDDRVEWNAAMREKAKSVYRRMQAGEVVMIGPDSIDVIQWMRGKGVRIRARELGGGTVYELVERVAQSGEAKL